MVLCYQLRIMSVTQQTPHHSLNDELMPERLTHLAALTRQLAILRSIRAKAAAFESNI
jgi:hypothetical protein